MSTSRRRILAASMLAGTVLAMPSAAYAAPDPGWTVTDLQPPAAGWTVTRLAPLAGTHGVVPRAVAPRRAPAARTPTTVRRAAQRTRATPRRAAVKVAHGTLAGTWRVGPGDTLWDIARINGTSIRRLVAANARRHPSLLRDPDLIQVGWRLAVPRSSR